MGPCKPPPSPTAATGSPRQCRFRLSVGEVVAGACIHLDIAGGIDLKERVGRFELAQLDHLKLRQPLAAMPYLNRDRKTPFARPADASHGVRGVVDCHHSPDTGG